jgi:hypothetical protein
LNLGRLKSANGDVEAAQTPFQQAASIIKNIAATVNDPSLREGFLNSAAVREIVSRAG